MEDLTSLVLDLVEWSDPRPVGRSGVKVCSEAHDLNDEFWEVWRERKDELRDLGFRVLPSHNDDGQFLAQWIRLAGTDRTQQRTDSEPELATAKKVTRWLQAPQDYRVKFPHLHPDQVNALWTLTRANKDEAKGTLDASDAGMGKTWIALEFARQLGLPFGVVCPANVVTKWTDTAIDNFNLEPEFVLSYDKLRTGNHGFVVRGIRRKKTVFDWDLLSLALLIFDEVHLCAGVDTLNSALLRAAVTNPLALVHMMSATVADSPLDMKATGEALGLHQGRDFWRWCMKNGARPGPFGGLLFDTGARGEDKLTKNQKRARVKLAKIHGDIFPGRGCRLLVGDSVGLWRPVNQVMAEFVDVEKTPRAREWLETMAELEKGDEARAEEREDVVSALTVTTRDRQWAELLLLPTMLGRTRQLVKEGNQVAIFLNFRFSIMWLVNEFSKITGETPSVITGGLSEKARETTREAYQEGRTKVIVCQSEAGGASIDLDDQRGDAPRCVLVSPGYKAKQLYQILGRSYRPASTKSQVRQWILFALGTIAEQVGRVVQVKLNSQALINDGDLQRVVKITV